MNSVARLVVIAWFIWVALARFAIGRIAIAFVRDPEEKRSRIARLHGRLLRHTMERLGASFIKLGQVMSTRPDLLDPETIDELKRLQDQLPAFPFSSVERILEEDLGDDFREHFRKLEEAPIAAASVAQVHRGELSDGARVAIKVLRPNIRAVAERDAVIMKMLARIGAIIPAVRASDPVGHLDHFFRGILDQTDLRIERSNYERFRKNFEGVEGVVFPRVYDELSGPRVLTMEFLEGKKIEQLDPDEDHTELVERLRNGMLKMLFEDGFLHADLHPGNFVITERGEVAIFDVGLVKELSEEMLVQYIDWNRCLVMGTIEDNIRHMRRYYIQDVGDVDWDEMGRDIAEFTSKFRGRALADFELGDLVNDAFAIGRKYKVRPVTEMTLIMVGVITAEGVGKQLDPDSDSLAMIADYLTPILERRGMLTEGAAES